MPEEPPTEPTSSPEQDTGADMVPIIERIAGTMVGATTEADMASVVSGRSLSPEEVRASIILAEPAMHPYRPAEYTPKGLVRKFYGTPENKPSMVAWRGIDVLLSKGEEDVERQLGIIRAELDEAYAASVPTHRRMKRVRAGETMPGEAEWSSLARLRASLPGFIDRFAGRPVSDESAALTQRALIRDVMPFAQDAGILSEVIAAALLARSGGKSFAFPSSLREESTRLRNEQGKLFNHDMYQLTPDLVKIPLQIKTRKIYHYRDTNQQPDEYYDPGIVHVPLIDWIAPVIWGPDAVITDPSRFLEYVRTTFVIPTPAGRAILDAAAEHFSRQIHDQAVQKGIVQP